MDITDDLLHVWYSPSLDVWKASGSEGDYGISHSRNGAVDIAVDASRTRGPSYRWKDGLRPIVVHARVRGTIVAKLVPSAGEGSSQLFQDAVP